MIIFRQKSIYFRISQALHIYMWWIFIASFSNYKNTRTKVLDYHIQWEAKTHKKFDMYTSYNCCSRLQTFWNNIHLNFMWIGSISGWERDKNSKFLYFIYIGGSYQLVLTTAENWLICLCGVELSYANLFEN